MTVLNFFNSLSTFFSSTKRTYEREMRKLTPNKCNSTELINSTDYIQQKKVMY